MPAGFHARMHRSDAAWCMARDRRATAPPTGSPIDRGGALGGCGLDAAAEICAKLESLVDDAEWPLPKFSELLFTR